MPAEMEAADLPIVTMASTSPASTSQAPIPTPPPPQPQKQNKNRQEQEQNQQPLYSFYAQNPLFKAAVDADQAALAPWRSHSPKNQNHNQPKRSTKPQHINPQLHRRMTQELTAHAHPAAHPAATGSNVTYAPYTIPISTPIPDSDSLPDSGSMDITTLRATIAGPPSTPFETHIYKIHITLPETYPASPPLVRFLTPLHISHPNIGADGAVRLDILDADAGWCPALSVDKVLQSVSSVLDAPCF